MADDDGGLLSVLYASTVSKPMGDAELAELLALSRLNNARRDLTGLLLHRDGQFMQVLEGPPAAVRALLATIAADARHSGVWVVAEERIPERRYGSWSMGYRSLTPDDLDAAPDWFGSAGVASVRTEGRAGELLAWFRDR